MKVSIGLAFDTNELDMISDFVIASEIPRIRSMNDESTGNLKIEVLRKCAKEQMFLLFPNPILDVIAQNPDVYQDTFVGIELRIPRGENDFFVFENPGSDQTVIAKGHDSVPKNFQRIYLADLIFDYLGTLGNSANIDNTDVNRKISDDCQSLDIYEILDKHEDLRKYLGIDTIPLPENAGKSFQDIPELESVSTYFVENNAQFTYNSPTFFDLIRAIYKNFMTSVNLKVLLESNWSDIVLERVDPNLHLLEAWITGHGKTADEDFEKAVMLLLHLCGYRTVHVGGQYETATQQQRRTLYGKSKVGIDVLVFSLDNKEVILCQCTTEWKDVKPSDVLILSPELRSRMLALPGSPELHFAVVTCDSKKRLPQNMSIPNGVRIIDIADLLTLLNEVKKGIYPYYLARKLFLS